MSKWGTQSNRTTMATWSGMASVNRSLSYRLVSRCNPLGDERFSIKPTRIRADFPLV